jgi:hypothetical protein
MVSAAFNRFVPGGSQLGGRAANGGCESILVELVRVKDLSSFEHEVHRAGELRGQHRECFALAVLLFEPLV